MPAGWGRAGEIDTQALVNETRSGGGRTLEYRTGNAEQVLALTRMFSPTMTPRRETAPLAHDFGGSVGDTFTLLGRDLGYFRLGELQAGLLLLPGRVPGPLRPQRRRAPALHGAEGRPVGGDRLLGQHRQPDPPVRRRARAQLQLPLQPQQRGSGSPAGGLPVRGRAGHLRAPGARLHPAGAEDLPAAGLPRVRRLPGMEGGMDRLPGLDPAGPARPEALPVPAAGQRHHRHQPLGLPGPDPLLPQRRRGQPQLPDRQRHPRPGVERSGGQPALRGLPGLLGAALLRAPLRVPEQLLTPLPRSQPDGGAGRLPLRREPRVHRPGPGIHPVLQSTSPSGPSTTTRAARTSWPAT